jgi:serine protease Do
MRNPRLTVLLLGLLMISCKPQAQTLPDFTGMAEKHGAAVVNISTVRSGDAGTMRERLQGQLPDFLEDFMGERFGEQFDGPRPSPKARSVGSGFIISEDGYVLTNYHVIAKAEKVSVQLRDRREFEAEIVGTDQQSDLALLKVDASGLPSVKIGSSEALQVGEWVMAIGAPFGFENTITKGIVSAKGRSLPNENYVPFIQTDAAVNPGNSGGPLFNMDGEVVGVNSQIVSRSGGFNGLSFAVPIDMAMNVVEQLKEHGEVTRGWLGVMIQEVDRELAESFDMERPRGALVAQVMSDSPAEKAGFKPGDIVIEFNGRSIETSSKLPHIVGRLEPGSERANARPWMSPWASCPRISPIASPGPAAGAVSRPRARVWG